MDLKKILLALLGLLPDAARVVINVQKRMGVMHPTVVGNLAEWILRGERRTANGGGENHVGRLTNRSTDPVEITGGGS
jgi:hypothetical protein